MAVDYGYIELFSVPTKLSLHMVDRTQPYFIFPVYLL